MSVLRWWSIHLYPATPRRNFISCCLYSCVTIPFHTPCLTSIHGCWYRYCVV